MTKKQVERLAFIFQLNPPFRVGEILLRNVKFSLRSSEIVAAGIKLYGGVSGSCDAAVENLLKGDLAFNPNAKCNHHDHNHENGNHTCGSHTCETHNCN